jgi:hypothetical protein
MPSHTVQLNGRDPELARIRFTFEEASAMLDKGFRFSVFHPPEELYRLSIPYRIWDDRDHGTVTFMQD